MQPMNAHQRAIRIWLYAVAGLVFLMVMVGGATRLTDSGLSIVEWRPVTGTLPPLDEAGWLAEFDKYKTSSEYQLVNKGMTLGAFKRIYWWEWGHRFLGRAIGVVFLLPFLFFLWRGWVEPKLKPRLWLIFGLGGLQGAIGWWMVASGLVGRVDVAQERLAIHLTVACLILIAIVWTARGMTAPRPVATMPRRLVWTATAILVLTIGQIALGGLVAGLKAGLVYDTWPLIDGALVPARERLLFLDPGWLNVVDNHLTVQFNHRMAAYVVLALALGHAFDGARHGRRATRRRDRRRRAARRPGRARRADASVARAARAGARASGGGDRHAGRRDRACRQSARRATAAADRARRRVRYVRRPAPMPSRRVEGGSAS